MSIVDMIVVVLTLILAATMGILMLFYAPQVQIWHIRFLKQLGSSSFWVWIAESKYALWQTRFVGLCALIMFLFMIYTLLSEGSKLY